MKKLTTIFIYITHRYDGKTRGGLFWSTITIARPSKFFETTNFSPCLAPNRKKKVFIPFFDSGHPFPNLIKSIHNKIQKRTKVRCVRKASKNRAGCDHFLLLPRHDICMKITSAGGIVILEFRGINPLTLDRNFQYA